MLICNLAALLGRDGFCELACALPCMYLNKYVLSLNGIAEWDSSAASSETIPEPLGAGSGQVCDSNRAGLLQQFYTCLPKSDFEIAANRVRFVQAFGQCWKPEGSPGYVLAPRK